MEKEFKVSLWEEVGGFVYIMAENEKAAKKKAQEILDDEGVRGFNDTWPGFEATHRETDILDIEEEKGE